MKRLALQNGGLAGALVLVISRLVTPFGFAVRI